MKLLQAIFTQLTFQRMETKMEDTLPNFIKTLFYLARGQTTPEKRQQSLVRERNKHIFPNWPITKSGLAAGGLMSNQNLPTITRLHKAYSKKCFALFFSDDTGLKWNQFVHRYINPTNVNSSVTL